MANSKRIKTMFREVLALMVLSTVIKITHGVYCDISGRYGYFITKDVAHNRRYHSVTYKHLVCQNITSRRSHPFSIENRNYVYKYIIFQNSSLLELPPALFKQFQEVTTIYLNHSEVETINVETFNVLPHLKALYLHNNRITGIENRTFSYLPNLKILNLSKNKFFMIENISLGDLASLEQLYLSHNYLTKIPKDAFASLVSLKILDLSFNRLYEIVDSAFANLFNLQRLFLGYNFLNHLSNNVFKNTNHLHHLDISFNQLETINFGLLPDTLETLQINHNKVRNAKYWKHVHDINVIDMSHNKFSDILIGQGVAMLYAYNNDFKTIGSFVFAEANDLIGLDLSRNVIQHVDENSFRNLTKLERLDLSFNRLKNLTVGSFKNLASLCELRLSSNSLSNLEYGTFAGLDNLTVLFLDNNHLKVVHENSFYVLAKLKALYLMNNLISSLDALQLISHVTKLNTFIFYGNKWKCSSLFGVIKTLSRNGIGFRNGSDYFVQNINGIHCTNGKYDFNDYEEEFQEDQPSTASGKRENKYSVNMGNFFNSYLNRMISKLQESFNKTNFAQYVNKNVFDLNYFKILKKYIAGRKYEHFRKNVTENINTDDEKPKNSSESDNGVAYFDRQVSDSISSEDEDFLRFANKIAVCTLLNAALLFIMILLFIFVMFRKNRKP